MRLSSIMALAYWGMLFPALSAAEPATARLAVREGRFVEKETGKPFMPLGMNYFRTGKASGGKVVHATFCPGFYDRAFVERMMADVAAWGFNTVRTFQAYHVGEEGILTSPQAREINPAYLENLLYFLRQARQNGVHVIFSWDIWMPPSDWWSSQPLPGEADADLRPAWVQEMGVNGFRFCQGSVRTRANAIVALIEAIRKRDAALLPVVLAWELENEVYWVADKAPFSTRQGVFHFAGRDYDLASDEQTQALMDDAIAQWAGLCAGAIHKADPEALVSTGVLTFAAVGGGGPGTLSRDRTQDARIPARPLALLRSGLDYLDIHLYAWKTEKEGQDAFLGRNLGGAEWERLKEDARKAGKPILAGESGVFANYLRKPPEWAIDHAQGKECLRQHVKALRERGFAGTLYWHYGNPDSTPNDEHPTPRFFADYAAVIREAWGDGRP